MAVPLRGGGGGGVKFIFWGGFEKKKSPYWALLSPYPSHNWAQS